MLSRSNEVTIVARNFPGDSESREWSSPWAGACFLGLDGSTPFEQKLQADSFSYLWSLAKSDPESSVRVRYTARVYGPSNIIPDHRDARPTR